MRRDAILVHPQPRTNEQHGSAGGAENIRNDRAEQQEQRIRERRRVAFHIDVDAARHDIERTDQRDEADVLDRRVPHRGPSRGQANQTDNKPA